MLFVTSFIFLNCTIVRLTRFNKGYFTLLLLLLSVLYMFNVRPIGTARRVATKQVGYDQKNQLRQRERQLHSHYHILFVDREVDVI